MASSLPLSDAANARTFGRSQSTKERLVLTAERLFALHGLEGVSLRQISSAAGNANNSAVQYHFDSKEGLIQAIFEHRVPGIMRRRRLLEAERGNDDLRSTIEVYLLPILEEAEDIDSYYMPFLVQLARYGLGEHPFDRLPEEFKQPTFDYIARVSSFLDGVPAGLRATRAVQTMVICTHVSSDRQLAIRHGAPVTPYPLHASELFDGLMGLLQAPVSPATIEALAAAPAAPKWRFVLP
jgi:AcrR family transcriptional regulator